MMMMITLIISIVDRYQSSALEGAGPRANANSDWSQKNMWTADCFRFQLLKHVQKGTDSKGMMKQKWKSRSDVSWIQILHCHNAQKCPKTRDTVSWATVWSVPLFANGSFFDSLQIKWALFQTVCLFEASGLNFLNPVGMESTWQTVTTSRCPHLGIGNADMSGGAWAFELEAKQNDRTESTQAMNLNSVWLPITFCLLSLVREKQLTLQVNGTAIW